MMKTQDRFFNILFYISVLLFFLGFNFTDNPPSGWYLQTLPNLNGKGISDVYFLDSLNGWAVTPYSHEYDTAFVLKTTNGGDNWNIAHTRINQWVGYNKIKFLNVNTGFVCGVPQFNVSYSGLNKSTDGGNSWVSLNVPDIYPLDMSILNQDTIWLVSSESLTGGVFRTTNGGLNWTQQLAAGTQNPNKIYMYNSRIGFIVDNQSSNNLRKTTDGGNSWLTVISGEGFYDIKFIDSLTGWRAKDYIKKTTDGGLTWIQQTLPSGISGHQIVWGMRNFSVINKDSLWGGYSSVIFPNLQYRGVLYRTTNGGNNWYYQIPDTALNVPLYNYISFINKNIGWGYTLNSTVNRGIHTTTGGDTTFYTDVIQISTEIPKDYMLYQNYPNPFNPKTTIEYEIKRSGYITLAVYDIRGKEMTTLVSQKQTPGKYLVDFPGVLFPSGIYFYRLSTDGKPIATKKMMLIK